MEDDINKNAYHEAGHAVANYLNDFKTKGVWIDEIEGATKPEPYTWKDESVERSKKKCVCALSGRIAEVLFFGDYNKDKFHYDALEFDYHLTMIIWPFNYEKGKEYEEQYLEKTGQLLDTCKNKKAIEVLAQALLSKDYDNEGKKCIKGEEAEQIIKEALKGEG